MNFSICNKLLPNKLSLNSQINLLGLYKLIVGEQFERITNEYNSSNEPSKKKVMVYNDISYFRYEGVVLPVNPSLLSEESFIVAVTVSFRGTVYEKKHLRAISKANDCIVISFENPAEGYTFLVKFDPDRCILPPENDLANLLDLPEDAVTRGSIYNKKNCYLFRDRHAYLNLDAEKKWDDIPFYSRLKLPDDFSRLVQGKDVQLPSMQLALNNDESNEDQTPTLSDDALKKLSRFLKELIDMFQEDKRERDISLLSCLTILSSLFPYHYGIYDRRNVGANLFLFITAPASAGKGIVSLTRLLGASAQERLNEHHEDALREYAEDVAALKNDGAGNIRPEKPKKRIVFIPVNNSTAKIIDVMSNNVNFGTLFDTEADTMVTALKNDWANYSDIIRKAFQHEQIDYQRKQEDKHIEIVRSHLSIVLTGTPRQGASLLKTVENGFFSRFCFYTFPLNPYWRDVFPTDCFLPEEGLKDMSLELTEYLREIPSILSEDILNDEEKIQFSLTKQQEFELNELFGHLQMDAYDLYGDDLIASVRRMGLITFRLAMILSIIRQIDCAEPTTEITCTDDDFQVAMSISNTLLQHTKKIYSDIASTRDSKSETQSKIYELFDALPSQFTRQDILQIADEMSIKEKTASYRIDKFIREGKVKRTDFGLYEKVS